MEVVHVNSDGSYSTGATYADAVANGDGKAGAGASYYGYKDTGEKKENTPQYHTQDRAYNNPFASSLGLDASAAAESSQNADNSLIESKYKDEAMANGNADGKAEGETWKDYAARQSGIVSDDGLIATNTRSVDEIQADIDQANLILQKHPNNEYTKSNILARMANLQDELVEASKNSFMSEKELADAQNQAEKIYPTIEKQRGQLDDSQRTLKGMEMTLKQFGSIISKYQQDYANGAWISSERIAEYNEAQKRYDEVMAQYNAALTNHNNLANAYNINVEEFLKRTTAIDNHAIAANALYGDSKENRDNALLEAAYATSEDAGMEAAAKLDEANKDIGTYGRESLRLEAQKQAEEYALKSYSGDFEKKAAEGWDMYEAPTQEELANGEFHGNIFRAFEENPYLSDNRYRYTSFATQQEKDTYSYILATEGESAADKFYDWLFNTLAARAGEQTANAIGNIDSNLGRTLVEAGVGFASGLESSVVGLLQNTTSDPNAFQNSATTYAQRGISEDIATRNEEAGKKVSLEQMVNMASESIGNMMPSLAMGSISGGLGAVTIGASSKGSTYRSLLEQGYTPEQADTVSTILGAAEATTSYLIGGVAKLGGKLVGLTEEKLMSKVSNTFARAMTKLGLENLSEINEEFLQNKIEAVVRNKYLGEDNSIALNDEDLQTVLTTALTTTLLQGGATVRGMKSDMATKAIGRYGINMGSVTAAVEMGLKSANLETVELAKGIQDGSLKTDPQRVGELLTQLNEEAHGGNIQEKSSYDTFMDSLALKKDGETATESAAPKTEIPQIPDDQSIIDVLETDAERRDRQRKAEETELESKRFQEVNAILNGNSSSKAASTILSSPGYLKVFESQFGKVEGQTGVERQRNLANKIRDIQYRQQNGESIDVGEGVSNTQENVTQPSVQTEEKSAAETSLGTNQATQVNAGIDRQSLLDERTDIEQRMSEIEDLAFTEDDEPESYEEYNTLKAQLDDVNARITAFDNGTPIAPTNSSATINQQTEKPKTVETSTPQTQPSAPPIPTVGEEDATPPAEKVSKFSTNSGARVAESVGAEQEPLKYTPITERQTLNEALGRVAANMVGEMNTLADKPNWSAADVDTAMTILGKLRLDSIKTNDSTAADEWAKAIKERTVAGGQFIQAFAKWARTGMAIALDAAEKVNQRRDIDASQKKEINNKILDFANKLDKMGEDDIEGLRKLIKEQSEYRNTGTFFDANFEKCLEKETDIEWLQEYAYRQLAAIPGDMFNEATFGDRLKTWQVNSQLTRIPTFFRNLGGNLGFQIQDVFAQDTFGIALDHLVSNLTGRREVAFDKSWFSSNARSAAGTALNRSILEVAGDVDINAKENRYGFGTGRTNKMSGNGFERAMSRWEQLLGYSLTSSDRFFRGAIEESYAEGLRKLNEKNEAINAKNAEKRKSNPLYKGKDMQILTEEEIAQIASEMADYRLFQNTGIASGITKGAHDLMNIVGIGGSGGVTRNPDGTIKVSSRKGGFGVGDFVMPYPGVPANLGVKAIEYSPANIVKGAAELVKVLHDIKTGNYKIGSQQQAVMDMARGMTGVPIIAVLASMFKHGIIKNWDDEDDKDAKAQNKADGLTGVQINLSAAMRAFKHESTEWGNNEDVIMKISWIEPLNAFMAIASLMADETDLEGMAGAYIEGTIQSFLDMPVMESIKSITDTFQYSNGETNTEKLGEAAISFAGTSLTGMIPAPFSQLASATDPYQRDTVGASAAETVGNKLLNAIPGARKTLPVKVDNFGSEVLNYGNAAERWANTFALPGAIDTYRRTDRTEEAFRIYEATGNAAAIPDRNAPSKVTITDPKTGKKSDIILTPDERRAFESNKNVDELYDRFFASRMYNDMTDDQRGEVLSMLNSFGEGKAKEILASGRGEKYQSGDILGEAMRGEDAVSEKNIITYASYRQMLSDSMDKYTPDYAATDKLVRQYGKLPADVQAAISNSLNSSTHIDKLVEYADLGIGSKDYMKLYDSTKAAAKELETTTESGLAQFKGLLDADLPPSELETLLTPVTNDEGEVEFQYLTQTAQGIYDVFKDNDLTVQDAYKFLDEADHTLLKNGDWQSNGKISADEAYVALQTVFPQWTEGQRKHLYNALQNVLSNYYNAWGKYKLQYEYSYESEGRFVTKNNLLRGKTAMEEAG